MRIKLFFLSILFTILFTFFSYSVAKEQWQQIDFDTTVKLQDHISRRFDGIFSYFSIIGSVEVTAGFCLILMVLALIRRKWLAVIGWALIIPASMAEVFGKLIVFHPGPPVLFHRTLISTDLPVFYIHTNFSYPSGHMTRTIFIITVFASMMVFSTKNSLLRLIVLSLLASSVFLMGMTRVYLGEHWLSDVLGGGLLGAAAGFLAAVFILRKPQD